MDDYDADAAFARRLIDFDADDPATSAIRVNRCSSVVASPLLLLRPHFAVSCLMHSISFASNGAPSLRKMS